MKINTKILGKIQVAVAAISPIKQQYTCKSGHIHEDGTIIELVDSFGGKTAEVLLLKQKDIGFKIRKKHWLTITEEQLSSNDENMEEQVISQFVEEN